MTVTKLICSPVIGIIIVFIQLILVLSIRIYCLWNYTTYLIMPLILQICIVSYIILAAPLLYKSLRNILTFGEYPITDYNIDAVRLLSTLIPPSTIVSATWVYHCPHWFGFLWPDWLEKMYQQEIITTFAMPMALCTAAILILYLISYFHFRGDTNDQP